MTEEIKIKEITITEQGMNDDIALLKKVDKNPVYARILKARVVARDLASSPANHAFMTLICHALDHPGGRIERILRKRGFLVPEITINFHCRPRDDEGIH